MRKTKIVCTIGPASRSPEILEDLIQAGMNVARLNFSHGSQAEHAEVIKTIRNLSDKTGKPVAILQDISGPKIRIGMITGGTTYLQQGEDITLTDRDVPGDNHKVSVSFQRLPEVVCEGDTILLSDGDIELEVKSKTENDVICSVVIGGSLSSHKGLNLPTRSIAVPLLTEKDKSDLQFGLGQDVDYIALSFVRNAEEIQEVRQTILDAGYDTPLIAKIEKHEALQNIDAIIEVVDGVMIARGDLGVEIPLQRVPLVQKSIIAKANRAGKPVITATQMMRSMVESPRPTRAEVTDVANAILDGTDAVMLSEESAIGRYPLRAVIYMCRIAEDVETGFPYETWLRKLSVREEKFSPEDAVAQAACRLAQNLHADAIVSCTRSGSTARLVAKYRPAAPILAPTPEQKSFQQLALVWGVRPLLVPEAENTDKMINQVCKTAKDQGKLNNGDQVVLTAGVPPGIRGLTNLIRVLNIGENS